MAETAFGALNSRDLDAFTALIAEDVEFTSLVAEIEGTTFHGHDGVRAWWETVISGFGDVRWDVVEVRGAGDRAVAHVLMAGHLGGVPVELPMWLGARLRGDKVIWWGFFRTEGEAVAAAEA
jgi:ketosteroid isomerase-like protein